MANAAANKDVLRKRVRRLLRLDHDGNEWSEVRQVVLPYLQSLGGAALIGGAIRDLARCGREGFSSDLDFVVYDSPRSRFLDKLDRAGARPNRFGGYGLKFHRWKVDVWHLEDTWARTAGIRKVDQLSDLLLCTFFDWDAAVYDLETGKLICEETYLQRIASGVMDVRLEENPNPEGALVRALRRAASWKIRFGADLSGFSSRQICGRTWDNLVQRDKKAFDYPVLMHLSPSELLERLQRLETVAGVPSSFPVPNWNRQLELPLGYVESISLSPHE